jgi:D-alanyl-lipoteichoic acid acyltransferase DltB (MBOAT superfamily)
MNFAESRFWVLLLAGLGVILLGRAVCGRWLAGHLEGFDKAALGGLGLFLLLCVSWVTFFIFVVVAVVSYAGMGWLVRPAGPPRKWLLLVLIPLQLLPLLYYKYASFILNEVGGADVPAVRGLVIPAGISFYTFQMMSFVIDTLAFRKPIPRPLDFLNFAGFFPQVVAGPIERREELLPQMQGFRLRWLPGGINDGAAWIAAGMFFKCCLADNAAAYFDGSSATNPFSIWLANLMFGLRIYYDFAGYSLVAVGLGRCFGIRLTLNFLSPYCATSIVEFWRRWHISLSQWFRDYVYVPMGGGRSRHWMFNVAVVFVVSGIWHGAGWNFMIWGALHGAALIINRLLGQRLKPPRFVAWLLTLGVAVFAWLSFYETRTPVLFAKMQTLCTPGAYSLQALREAVGAWEGGQQVVLLGLLSLATAVLAVEWLSVARRNEPYYYLRRPWVVIVLVVLTVWLAPAKQNAFIYFAF